jgi:hypothetical protein
MHRVHRSDPYLLWLWCQGVRLWLRYDHMIWSATFYGLKITTDDDPAENKEDSFDNEWNRDVYM